MGVDQDASPTNQVIIIEKEFGSFEFKPRQSDQPLSPNEDGKSPSGDHGSTDVNHSHVLSDHLTNKLVPMSIQDAHQGQDEDKDDAVKIRHQNFKCASQLYQKRTARDTSLSRHERERQSRYLLRNQRMRLFSPVTKAKYQNEMLMMRQSEHIDKIENDADSFSGSMGDRIAGEGLFSMLRIFRAVSPNDQSKDGA